MDKHTSYLDMRKLAETDIRSCVGFKQTIPNMVAGASGDDHASDSPLPIHIARASRAHSSGQDAAGEEADHWILLAGAVARWRRVVRKLWRIRRLQRIWAHLGQWLQQVAGRELRQGLRKRLL